MNKLIKGKRIISFILMLTIFISILTGYFAANSIPVYAFYVADGTDQDVIKLTITFYESVTFDEEGNVISSVIAQKVNPNGSTSDYIMKVRPTNTKADQNIYMYEYKVPEEVKYVSITYPLIEHEASGEQHNRMWWIGNYSGNINTLTDTHRPADESKGETAGEAYLGSDGVIDWWDFKETCKTPKNLTDMISYQQTWESYDATEENRTVYFNADNGGNQFYYLLETTQHEAHNNADSGQNNYSAHISMVIGLKFSNRINFIVGDDETTEQDTINVYYEEYTSNTTSGILPASKKSPHTAGHEFLGWYDENGNMVYDANGEAYVNTNDLENSYWVYNDASEKVWNYQGSIDVYPKFRELYYNITYDKGATSAEDTNFLPKDDKAQITYDYIITDKFLSGSYYRVLLNKNDEVGSTKATLSGTLSYDIENDCSFLDGYFPFNKWKWVAGNKTYASSSVVSGGFSASEGETITLTGTYNGATVALPSASRPGYNFTGWYREAETINKTNGMGVNITVSSSATNVDKWVYAGWEPKQYLLEYLYDLPQEVLDYANNKNIDAYTLTTNTDESSKDVIFDSTIGILPEPTLVGYKFNKWYWLSDNGTDIANTECLETQTYKTLGVVNNVVDGANNTIYAEWEPVKYKISYNLNGGTVDGKANPTEVSYYSDETVYTPTKEGCTFLGWKITGMDGGVHVIDGVESRDKIS